MATKLKLNPIPDVGVSASVEVITPERHPVLDIVAKAIGAKSPDMAQLTRLYLKLRAAKAELDAKAKDKTAPLIEGMAMIESAFLATMQELGVDSLKNEAGTPYCTERVSVTIADNDAFVRFVLGGSLERLSLAEKARDTLISTILDSGMLALLEARAAKPAVEAYIEANKEVPPGLNRSVTQVVNVRR